MTAKDLFWARIDARSFLAATSETPMLVWQSMPDDWTPATSILPHLPQSTVGTALGHLLRAGAVQSRRRGRNVLYRPRKSITMHAKVGRNTDGGDSPWA